MNNSDFFKTRIVNRSGLTPIFTNISNGCKILCSRKEQIMYGALKNVLIMMFLCALIGCLQTKEEFTLNPDGTGKVVYESTLPLVNPMMPDADPKELALNEVEKILKSSKGVETWQDVTFTVTDEGALAFKGTAYFRRLSALRIGGSIKNESSGAEFVEISGGGGELRLVEGKDDEAKPPAKKLSDEELTVKAKAEKAKFMKQKPMLTGFMAGFREEKIFHLPGTLDEVMVFKKTADKNTVSILYEGENILKALDVLIQDDEWWREQVRSGQDMDKGPPMSDLHEILFGTGGQARATLKGELKPLFDYGTEVAAAKKAYSAMRKKLGLIEEPERMPAASGGSFKSLRVGGVQLVHESDQKNGIRPFNYDKGYKISLICELPGSVLLVKNVSVSKAVADNGENLLPEHPFPSFPQLSNDKNTVIFNINLLVPGDNVKGLREVSGKLIYVVAEGTKSIDLGTLELKPGVKGEALNAEITSIEESKWVEGSYELNLKMNADKDNIKRVRFLDTDGNELDVESGGYEQMNRNLTLTFRSETEFPPRAHIIVDMYDKMQEYTIPFELNDISLLGLPIKPDRSGGN